MMNTALPAVLLVSTVVSSILLGASLRWDFTSPVLAWGECIVVVLGEGGVLSLCLRYAAESSPDTLPWVAGVGALMILASVLWLRLLLRLVVRGYVRALADGKPLPAGVQEPRVVEWAQRHHVSLSGRGR